MALKPKRITAKDVDGCGISIEIIKENKDGSADAKVTFSKQGLQTLVQWGVVALLTAAIDEYRVESEKSSKVATKRTRTATKKASKK
jgi:phage head maturation protease